MTHPRIACREGTISALRDLHTVDVGGDRGRTRPTDGAFDPIAVVECHRRGVGGEIDEIAERTIPADDLCIRIGHIARRPEVALIAAEIARRDSAAQDDLDFLVDAACLLIDRLDDPLSALIRPPGACQYGDGIIKSSRTRLRAIGKAAGRAEVRPVSAVRPPVEPIATFGDRVLSQGECSAVGSCAN